MVAKTKGTCARVIPWGKSFPRKTQILNWHSFSNRYPKRSCLSKGLSCTTVSKRQTRSCDSDIINNHGCTSDSSRFSNDRFICDAKGYELFTHKFRDTFDDLDGNRKTSGRKCLSSSSISQAAASTEGQKSSNKQKEQQQQLSLGQTDDNFCPIDGFIESPVSSVVFDDSGMRRVFNYNNCNSNTIESNNNHGEFIGANINVSTSAASAIDFGIDDDSHDSFFFDSILHQIFLNNLEKENVDPPMHNSKENAYYLNDIEHNNYCFNADESITKLLCTDDLPLSPSPSLDHCYAKLNTDDNDIQDLWSMPNSMFLPLTPPSPPPTHQSPALQQETTNEEEEHQQPPHIREAEFERFVHSAFSVFECE